MQEAPIIKPTGLKPLTAKPGGESDESKSGKSSGFVFGANLADRVVLTPDATTNDESARYTDLTSDKPTTNTLKRKFDAITGEEDEQTVQQAPVKLFVWNLDTSSWVEKGRGLLKLNDPNKEKSPPIKVPSKKEVEKEREEKVEKEEEEGDRHKQRHEEGKEEEDKEKVNREGKEDTQGEGDSQEKGNTQEEEFQEKEEPEEKGDTLEKEERGKETLEKDDKNHDTEATSPNKTIEFPRLIMRISGTLRIILNVAINPEHFKIVGTYDDDKSNVFRFSDSRDLYAVSGSAKDITLIRRAVERRLETKP